MSNLSGQFSGGPNPGLVAIAAIDKGLSAYEKHKRNKAKLDRLKQRNAALAEATVHHEHIESTINEVTNQPKMENKPMSTHPITGEQVPTVPVKRSNYKKTPPGTKPKKK